MIPNVALLTEEITEETIPGRTYRVLIRDPKSGNPDTVVGYIDDMESVKQAIYFILSTERYEYLIYSWDYGIETVDLIGKPIPYVMAELPRRVTDALTQDDRITDVTDFEFEKNRSTLHATFTVVTNVGNVETELEVDV